MTSAQQRRASFGGDPPRRAADEEHPPSYGSGGAGRGPTGDALTPTAASAGSSSDPAGEVITLTPDDLPSDHRDVSRSVHDSQITGRASSSSRSPGLPPGVGYPGAPRRDGSGRGRLMLPEKVVAKIASQAASEVGPVGGSTGGVLGIGSHADLNARPKADVELSGRTATIDVDLAVRYPTPIRQATERTRQHVMDRVHELTGVDVTRVDVNVVSLRTPDTNRREEGLR